MANRLVEKLGRRSAAYLRKLGGVDEAIRFLEKDEWAFGSGYGKADLIARAREAGPNSSTGGGLAGGVSCCGRWRCRARVPPLPPARLQARFATTAGRTYA